MCFGLLQITNIYCSLHIYTQPYSLYFKQTTDMLHIITVQHCFMTMPHEMALLHKRKTLMQQEVTYQKVKNQKQVLLVSHRGRCFSDSRQRQSGPVKAINVTPG